jgi:heme exporter protein D
MATYGINNFNRDDLEDTGEIVRRNGDRPPRRMERPADSPIRNRVCDGAFGALLAGTVGYGLYVWLSHGEPMHRTLLAVAAVACICAITARVIESGNDRRAREADVRRNAGTGS